MARPLKGGMEYFPHDTDSVNDEKIELMMSLYGPAGYALYFIMLERIYRSPEYELKISSAETTPEITSDIVRVLCRKVMISENDFTHMLDTALKYGLFDADEYKNRGVLTSKGIKKRAKSVEDKRISDRKRYEKSKVISEAETDEGKHSGNTTETGKSKVKKSNIYTANFLTFYSEYPRPQDKGRTLKNWNNLLKPDADGKFFTMEQLIAAGRNYKAANTGAEKKYLKSSANFLGQDRTFEDFLPKEPITPIQLVHRTVGKMGE